MNIVKLVFLSALLLLLSACASSSAGQGKSEVYGQVVGGVEHTHVSQ